MNISKKIELERNKKSLSQKEMAQRLNVTPAYYGRLEKRGDSLSIKQLKEISSGLGINYNSLMIDDFDQIDNQKILLNEFSELTVIYWIHDYLKEILENFKHDLSEDSLIIRDPGQKKLLVSILIKNVSYIIFSSILSSNLEGFLNKFFETKNISVFYYSKKEKIIEVDINGSLEGRNYNRGFTKKHNEL